MENNSNYTSFKKAMALMKWSNKKYTGVSIAYLIILFCSWPLMEIIALIISTTVMDSRAIAEYSNAMIEFTKYEPVEFFGSVAMIFTTIISFIVFSYMHNKRNVDLFGSFPISRRALFFSRYATALCLCMTPVLIVGLVGMLLTLNGTAMLWSIKSILFVELAIVGNISFIGFISLCCGTVADMIVSYIAVNCVWPIFVGILSLIPSSIIPGMDALDMSGSVYTFFSPLLAPMVGWLIETTYIHIIWWIFIISVILIACYFMSRRRAAEAAQSQFAFPVLEIGIKFLACFTVGAGLGWIFALVGSTFESVTVEYLWFGIGLVIGAMVMNVLLHLVFHRGLRGYAKSLIETTIVCVAGLMFIFVVGNGGIGYDKRIPYESDIESVAIKYNSEYEYEEYYVDGRDIFMRSIKDKGAISKTIYAHQKILEKIEENKNSKLYHIVPDNLLVDTEKEIIIEYNMKNGDTIKRKYDGTLADFGIKDEWNEIESKADNIPEVDMLNIIPLDQLDQIQVVFSHNFTNGYDSKKYSYHDDITGTIYADSYGSKNFSYQQKLKEELIYALRKDVEKWGYESLSEKTVLSLELEYYGNDNLNAGSYANASFMIDDRFTNTLKVLKKYNCLNKGIVAMLNGYYGQEYNIEYKDNSTEIYFKVPDDWKLDTEIRCNYVIYGEFALLYNDQRTICEKVSDNIYKAKVPVKIDGEKVRRVMFYQYDTEHFNSTGGVALSKDASKNILEVTDIKNDESRLNNMFKSFGKVNWSSFK